MIPHHPPTPSPVEPPPRLRTINSANIGRRHRDVRGPESSIKIEWRRPLHPLRQYHAQVCQRKFVLFRACRLCHCIPHIIIAGFRQYLLLAIAKLYYCLFWRFSDIECMAGLTLTAVSPILIQSQRSPFAHSGAAIYFYALNSGIHFYRRPLYACSIMWHLCPSVSLPAIPSASHVIELWMQSNEC